MPRRSLGDLLGVYKRDGRIVFGRAPSITDEQWKKVENPNRLSRFLASVGLTYGPERTRRKPFGGRTRD